MDETDRPIRLGHENTGDPLAIHKAQRLGRQSVGVNGLGAGGHHLLGRLAKQVGGHMAP